MSATPWFDEAFGSWYEAIYPHRSLDEAERIWSALKHLLPAEGPLLDIGCGTGRHMTVLAGLGYRVLGLDRSPALLSTAREALPGVLVRGDMRSLPFADATFSGVLSMFTSFGYFSRRRDHEDLLAEWRRVLVAGGRLILDYLNPAFVRSGLVPESKRRAGELLIRESRRILTEGEDDVVHKQVEVSRAGKVLTRYTESVTLYSAEVVKELSEKAGFEIVDTLGDYRGNPPTPMSPRGIYVMQS